MSCEPVPVESAASAEPAKKARTIEHKTDRNMSLHRTDGPGLLRENDVDVAPILSTGRALAGPVGRVVQVIGNMRGPEARDVAIEKVALNGLAQTCSAARGIDFPARIEN